MEVESVLPGCTCYPPRETLSITPCACGSSAPIILKHYRLDFTSQLEEGFGLYARVVNWVLANVTPEVMAGRSMTGYNSIPPSKTTAPALPMNDFLFVYGTLLPDLVPADLEPVMQPTRRVGPGTVSGRLHDLGDYPGLVQDGTTSARVAGEVLELSNDKDLLKSLDAYEGFDPAHPSTSLFRRARISVVLCDGSTISAWVYVYNRDPGAAPLVHGGDWKSHTPAKR